MPTRRVTEGKPRRQNGWASAVEFDDLRGLNGTAVALKVELIHDLTGDAKTQASGRAREATGSCQSSVETRP